MSRSHRNDQPLHYLVAEHLRAAAGQRLTPEDIAQGLIESHPDRFSDKQRRLGGRSELIDQLTREVYKERGTLLTHQSVI
jgi:hypothetical protein